MVSDVSGQGVTIRTSVVDHVCLLAIKGSLYLPDVPLVMQELTEAFAGGPHRAVVCDVSGLQPTMTDAFLSAFPASLSRAGGWPRVGLRLAAPGSELASQLRRVGMQRYLPVHAQLHDAMTTAEQEAGGERFEISLPPTTETLAVARDAVRRLWPFSATHGSEETVLVVNELAANAVRHVAESYRLSLVVTPERVVAAVTDPGSEPPRPQIADFTATGGRGLQLVAALSSSWGVRLVHRRGKTVWADLAGPFTGVPSPRTSAMS